MKRLIILFAALGLLACQQDPYGGKDVNETAPPKRDKPEPLPGADSLIVEKLMNFSEAAKGEYILKATVKGNGNTPVLKFTGLPTGAAYDANAQKFTWTPDYKAANDPNFPNLPSRDYEVHVGLFSSDDLVNERKSADVTLRVADTPLPASVKSPLDMRGTEGSTLVHKIIFEDQEYPSGPFEISQSGLPGDAILDWPDHRVPSFTYKWSPGYDKIINKSNEDYIGHVVIYNPRGKRLDFNIHWSVDNKYVAPQTTGPTDIAQPGDVDFIVIAEDLNGEISPNWDKVTSPPYGILTVTSKPITGPGHPKATGIVSWKAIPKDKLGIVQNIQLQACVNGFNCTNHTVKVLPMPIVLSQGARQ